MNDDERDFTFVHRVDHSGGRRGDIHITYVFTNADHAACAKAVSDAFLATWMRLYGDQHEPGDE